MLIDALIKYYDYLRKTYPEDIPAWGWMRRRVTARIVIDKAGNLRNIIPAEDNDGWRLIVPEQVRKPNQPYAYLLCDNVNYLLGLDITGEEDKEKGKIAWEASKATHLEFLKNLSSSCAEALKSFFENWTPDPNHPVCQKYKNTLSKPNTYVLNVDGIDAFSDPEIKEAVSKNWHPDKDDGKVAKSILSGKVGVCARTHPQIRGLFGGANTGASLINFNIPSFEGYGDAESQGLFAPMLVEEVHAYSTALNWLLESKSHSLILGDTTLVFWALPKNTNSENTETTCQDDCDFFKNILSGNFGDNDTSTPEANERELRAMLDMLRRGVVPTNLDLDADFYVYGFVPNHGRIMQKLSWHKTFKEIIEHILAYYDISCIKTSKPTHSEYVKPWWAAKSANITKKHKIKPSDPSHERLRLRELMDCVLEGRQFPQLLFDEVLIRASSEKLITQERASVARAYLIRNKRFTKEELPMDLNKENKNPAYLLGRAFRLMECIQTDARGRTSSNIRELYYASAAQAPDTIFPTLMDLSIHHLNKLSRKNPGRAYAHQRELAEIFSCIDNFPKHLTQSEKGLFLLGYFHEDTDLFSKRE